MSVCLSTFIHYVGSTWYLVLTTELQSTDFNWFIESRPVENLCYDCSHLLDVEEIVGGDAAPGVRVLPLQPVLEDALLAPHLLALAPAALAEQSAHGALVTHWSHPVSGHTLAWSHWVWATVVLWSSLATPGNTAPGRQPVLVLSPPAAHPTPEVNVSGSVDTIFIVSLHRTN